MALDDDKYKRPELTAADAALGAALPTYGGLKWAGGGNAIQGAKNIGGTAWNTTKALGRVGQGMAQTAGGVRGMAQGAKVAGGLVGRAAPVVSAGVATASTPTEDYYERFGFDKNTVGDSFAKDFGVRTLGFASDLGNALTLGQAGKYLYRDKIRQNNEAAANQAQTTPQATAQTGEDKRIYAQTSKQNSTAPIRNGLGLQGGVTAKSSAPQAPVFQTNAYSPTQLQGGITNTNPDYQALLKQVQTMQEDIVAPSQNALGAITHTPRRDWENEAQRKALLQQATTPIKGARGLTANQMRLAHDLSNDDIKLAQERHLQQNQLNHQLLQEQMQQQGQNARTLVGEQGQMARAVMNEQGQNNRFGANFGLDVAKFNEDNKNTQYELGLKGADLRARLGSQALDDGVKQGHLELYNQFVNAKDDGERDKILTQMAVLQGRGGTDKGDNFATVNLGERYDPETQSTINLGQALYNTRTGQYVDRQSESATQGNPDWHKNPNILKGIEQVNKKGGTAEEIRQAYIKLGVPADQVDAILAQQGA